MQTRKNMDSFHKFVYVFIIFLAIRLPPAKSMLFSTLISIILVFLYTILYHLLITFSFSYLTT